MIDYAFKVTCRVLPADKWEYATLINRYSGDFELGTISYI